MCVCGCLSVCLSICLSICVVCGVRVRVCTRDMHERTHREETPRCLCCFQIRTAIPWPEILANTSLLCFCGSCSAVPPQRVRAERVQLKSWPKGHQFNPIWSLITGAIEAISCVEIRHQLFVPRRDLLVSASETFPSQNASSSPPHYLTSQ